MNYVIDFIKGIIIGAGAILPGISSGVLCVIFGIYEKLLNCVLGFFKNFKYNFKFLFPIILGGLVGIIIFGNILKYIFYAFPIQTKSVFIGLILGSIPSLLRKVASPHVQVASQPHESKKLNLVATEKSSDFSYAIKKASNKQAFKLNYLIYIILSFCFGLFLVIFEKNLHINSIANKSFSPIYLIFSGFLMSAGVIIPGVSSTLILMLLGVYDAYLISVSSIYIPFLIPLGIGLLFGCLFYMKLIKYLFDKFYCQTIYCIIGFTLGSIFILLPVCNSFVEKIVGFIYILLGILCGYQL